MFAKQILKQVLSNKKVNHFIRMIPKPAFRFITDRFNIPVVGKVFIELPDRQYLVMETNGGDDVAQSLYWKGGFKGFEYETTKIFYNLSKKSNVIFDIGANTGYYALLAAISNVESQVFAFEPLPRVHEYLKQNIMLNGLSNVITVSSAVTNFDGNIILYDPGGNVPSSASTLKGFKEAEMEISVPAITLDSFVNKNQIEKVDLIKMDTEGTEYDVLEGSNHILKRDEPIIICEVLKGRTERFLETLLSDLEYKYYWITDKGLIQRDTIEGNSTYKHCNYLFCKEEKFNVITRS